MVSTAQLYDDVAYLTKTIGERLAGSKNERRAAEYLQKRFSQYVPKCWIEEFPMMERRVNEEKLELFVDGQWKQYPSLLYSLASSTNGETVEADLVVFEAPAEIKRKDLSYLENNESHPLIHFVFYYNNTLPAEGTMVYNERMKKDK